MHHFLAWIFEGPGTLHKEDSGPFRSWIPFTLLPSCDLAYITRPPELNISTLIVKANCLNLGYSGP